jgi:N-acetylglutamate synthase-like GNAT family acetyltransferase
LIRPGADSSSRARPARAFRLRSATTTDLDAVNAVIERAVMSWELPARVKRLVLPTYRYDQHDMQHLSFVVAEDSERGVVGVAAWEPASPRDLPAGRTGLLLHGLYVDPRQQRGGVGSRLLDIALAAAQEQGFDGLLVKAQPDAAEFFHARGLERLPVEDPDRDYPNRFWKAVARQEAVRVGTRTVAARAGS